MDRSAPPSRLSPTAPAAAGLSAAARARPAHAADAGPRRRRGTMLAANLAGAAMLAGAAVLSVQTLETQRQDREATDAVVAEFSQVRQQVGAAEQSLAAVPSEHTLARQVEAARAVGEQLAQKQQLFLDASTPVDSGLASPQRSNQPGARQPSQEQWHEQVMDYRAESTAQARRETGMLLDETSRTAVLDAGLDPTGPWHSSPGDHSAMGDMTGWTWSSLPTLGVDEAPGVGLVWTLMDPTGVEQMRVTGCYDARSARIQQLQVMRLQADTMPAPAASPRPSSSSSPRPSSSSSPRPSSSSSPSSAAATATASSTSGPTPSPTSAALTTLSTATPRATSSAASATSGGTR